MEGKGREEKGREGKRSREGKKDRRNAREEHFHYCSNCYLQWLINLAGLGSSGVVFFSKV